MSNLNPPPLTGDANLDRWLNLLHKRVIAPVVTVGQLGNYTDDAVAAAAGVPTSEYLGIQALAGAYGHSHPAVSAFRNRAKTGVNGPKTQEGPK